MTEANAIVITNPQTSGVSSMGDTIVRSVSALVVNDAESHAEAQVMLQSIKKIRAKVDDLFKEPTKLAYQTHRSFVAASKKLTDPLDSARKALIGKVVAYEEIEAKRAQEEADRLAEEQRKRDEEAAIAAAVEAESDGDSELADEILEEQELAPEPVVIPAPRVSTVSGISSTTRYSAECVNMLELITHIVEHPEHIEAVRINQTYINQLARAQRNNLRLPGVKVLSETSKSVRA